MTELLLLSFKPTLSKIHNLTLALSVSVCPSPSAHNLGFIFDAQCPPHVFLAEFFCCSCMLLREPTKTAHRQNGPNEGRKRPTQTKTAPTKTAPMEEKTRPKRPQLTSKTAHYVTLYKYRINDII